MTEASVIGLTRRPASRRSLTSDLRMLGVHKRATLIVHTSLSRLGGAQTVVEALLDAVGPKGTLVMPA